jgi:phenylalanyl-tRNA synthetase beta chain
MVFAAEMVLDKLMALIAPVSRYEPLPRFPGVFRDLSFVVKKSTSYSAIEQTIRSCAGPLLQAVECIDVFAGKGIAPDSRSIAISMTFRAADRTLSSEEIAVLVEQVIVQLGAEFGAELRSGN